MNNVHTTDQGQSEELECVDTEVGSPYLHEYLAGTLSASKKQDFEDHLVFCLKCQEDLQYLRWARQQLTKHFISSETPGKTAFWQAYAETPLPMSSVRDGNAQDLSHELYETPFMDQLAAADTIRGIAFPLTVEYAGGQIIGQFRRRAGQLFFKLKKTSDAEEHITCMLTYASEADPADVRTFEIRAGEDKRLGPFSEFVTAETIQGIVKAIKQFQLVVKKQE